MKCPKCGSTTVEKLPPSQISPHPGYRCNGCELKMRSHGMVFVYLFTLLFGLALCILCVTLLVVTEGSERPLKMLWLGGVGVIVAGYSVAQIMRPVPLKDTHTSDQ